jgi:hypothetical protein
MSSRVTHVLCDRVRHITIADYSEFTYVACTLPALCCSARVCAAVCASTEDGERLCLCGSLLCTRGLPALCCSARVCAAVCASNEDGERLCLCGSSLCTRGLPAVYCSAQLCAAACASTEDGERLCVCGSSLCDVQMRYASRQEHTTPCLSFRPLSNYTPLACARPHKLKQLNSAHSRFSSRVPWNCNVMLCFEL